MNIFPAQNFDIDSIMKIEHQAFIPQIQEKKKTFEKRLEVFSNGFLILSDCSENVVKTNGSALTIGYLCSEIWDSMPNVDDDEKVFTRKFKLGHNIKDTHNEKGCYLYVSSFALLRDYQGKGLGKKFFESSVCALCSSFSNVKQVVLLVNSEWQNAIKIYESFGFKTIKTLPDFFPTLQKKIYSPAIVMTADSETFRKESESTETQNPWEALKI